jgi:hypothetical protein
MLLQGCFQALNLSTHRSIIGRSTTQHMIRPVVLIHLGVISSVAHLFVSRISLSRISHSEPLHRKYLSAMRWRILVRASSYLYRGDLL